MYTSRDNIIFKDNAKITRRGLNHGGKTTDRNSPVGLIDSLGNKYGKYPPIYLAAAWLSTCLFYEFYKSSFKHFLNLIYRYFYRNICIFVSYLIAS